MLCPVASIGITLVRNLQFDSAFPPCLKKPDKQNKEEHEFFFHLQVDVFQMCILEFKNRPGKPLYHLEHYIDGKYIKYNSNSGFVEENLRNTPQVKAKLVLLHCLRIAEASNTFHGQQLTR